MSSVLRPAMKTKIILLLFTILLVLLSVSCSTLSPYIPELKLPSFSPTPTPIVVLPTPTPTARPIENQPRRVSIIGNQPAPAEQPGLEIVWRGSTSEVAGYRIRYGNRPDQLDKKIELPNAELRRWQIPEKVNEYRYILQNVSTTETCYVQVEAYTAADQTGVSTVVASEP